MLLQLDVILELILVLSKLKIITLLSALLVAACGQNSQVPASATAIVGTKAVVKYHRRELVSVVTDVTDKLVTTEFSNWNGDLAFTQTDYRGLLAVSGSKAGGHQWELDFNENLLEAFFPLEVGKEVAFEANIKYISSGKSFDLWGHLEVLGDKVIDLADGKRKVKVIEYTRRFAWDGKTKLATDIIYYDPEYSMTLKRVMREEGSQTFWRVISVERPGNVVNTPTRQRRSGTVMI